MRKAQILLLVCILSVQLPSSAVKTTVEESPYYNFLKSVIAGRNEVQDYVEKYGVAFLKQKNSFHRDHYSILIPSIYLEGGSSKKISLTAYDIAIASGNYMVASDIDALISAITSTSSEQCCTQLIPVQVQGKR